MGKNHLITSPLRDGQTEPSIYTGWAATKAVHPCLLSCYKGRGRKKEPDAEGKLQGSRALPLVENYWNRSFISTAGQGNKHSLQASLQAPERTTQRSAL